MATHSSILAWKIPWTEESGGLQSKGPQRVGPNWVHSHTHKDKDRNRTCLPTLKTESDLFPWCQNRFQSMLEGSAHPITGPVAAQSNTLPTAPAVFCSVQSHPPEDLEFLLQGIVWLTCICVHKVTPYLIAMTLRIVAPGHTYGPLRTPATATLVTGSLK